MVNRSSALYDFKFAKVCFMAKDIAGHGECPLEKNVYVSYYCCMRFSINAVKPNWLIYCSDLLMNLLTAFYMFVTVCFIAIISIPLYLLVFISLLKCPICSCMLFPFQLIL